MLGEGILTQPFMLWLLLFLCADSFETTFRAGLTALNNNNLALAEVRLQSASRLQPQNAQVWLALAQTYWKLQKSQASERAARNAESFAKDPVMFHGLAFYYSEAGK